MRTITSEIEDKVDELLACLDTDARHIQESLSYLNELRSLVIKRDDAALGKLLEGIRAESDRYGDHESQRQSIRRELARMIGCDFERMTLSALASYLPESRSERVVEMQTKLRELIKELKKEYSSTTLLLAECARLNSLLLRTVLDLGRTGAVYYNSSGTTKRQVDTAFMNLQF